VTSAAPPSTPPRRRPRSRDIRSSLLRPIRFVRDSIPRRVLIAGLVVVALLTIDLGVRGFFAYRALRDVEAASSRAIGLLGRGVSSFPTSTEYEEALAALQVTARRSEDARWWLSYWASVPNVFAWVPRVGPQVAATDELLDLAVTGASAGADAMEAARPIFTEEDIRASINSVLAKEGERIQADLARIAAQGPVVHRLAATHWDGPLARIGRVAGRLDAGWGQVEAAAAGFGLARSAYPGLLGFGDQRPVYMIAGQNDHEIRASGGFLGSFGVVTLKDGRIAESEYSRVAAWEPGSPPYPRPPIGFRLYYGGGWWRLRDVNWYPNFPDSARAIIDTVAGFPGKRLDGVIATNHGFITRLLEVYGPLQLTEFKEHVTAANWSRLADTAVSSETEAPGAAIKDARQYYLEPIMEALLKEITRLDRAHLPKLATALRASVAEREVQVYSRQSEVQAFLSFIGASGEMPGPAPKQDFLAVVDTNLSETKVGPGIERRVLYYARPDGATDVLVSWRNRATQLNPRDYPRINGDGVIFNRVTRKWDRTPNVFGNYVRIYLPPDAIFERIDGFDSEPRLERDGPHMMLSGFVVVKDGQQGSVQFSYRANGNSGEAPRQVTIWKQSGVAEQVRVVAQTALGQQTRWDGPYRSDHEFAIR